ncbi:MAG: hypothetical protein U9N80_07210 [Chloroflexota bacterium]|nr:hypothetical protein [Chloroflexota bacterium]
MQLGLFPSWSPDGRLLAWYSPPYSLRVWNEQLGVITDYTSPLDYIDFSSSGRGDGLSWSPNGSTIFLQGPGLTLDLSSGAYDYRLPVEDGLDQCCFTWSPYGRYLAFLSHDRLLVYEGNTRVFKSDTAASAPMSWSQNGESLAWSKGSWFENDLALTHIPTSTTRVFDTSQEASLRYPTWSLEGESIAAIGYHTIHVLSLGLADVTSPGEILSDTIYTTPDINMWSGLTFSPDGQSIAYDSDEGSIVFINRSGSRHILRDLLPSISRKPSAGLGQ